MKKTGVEVIDRFSDSQILDGKSELTARTYAYTLTKLHEWLLTIGGDINDLTRHDVQTYMNHLSDSGMAASSITKTYAAISVFARFINRPKVMENIRKVEYRKQRNVAPKSLDRNAVHKLLRDVEHSANLRNSAIVHVLLHTGLRVSELCALDREDIDMSERKGGVTIRHGKGNVSRTVPLSADTRHHVQKYLAMRDDHAAALFLSNERKRISVRAVQHMLKKYGIHPHTLRHTFCRDLVQNGVEISTVAELAGHADINVTRRYSKPSHEDLQKAIERAFS